MLATDRVSRHPPGMYVVSEADAAAIREAYETGGELSAGRVVSTGEPVGWKIGNGTWNLTPATPLGTVK